jgi:hypothetical protein
MNKSELRKLLLKTEYLIDDKNNLISHEEGRVKKLNDKLSELIIEKSKIQKDIDAVRTEINIRVEKIIDLKFSNEEIEKKLIDLRNKL